MEATCLRGWLAVWRRLGQSSPSDRHPTTPLNPAETEESVRAMVEEAAKQTNAEPNELVVFRNLQSFAIDADAKLISKIFSTRMASILPHSMWERSDAASHRRQPIRTNTDLAAAMLASIPARGNELASERPLSMKSRIARVAQSSTLCAVRMASIAGPQTMRQSRP